MSDLRERAFQLGLHGLLEQWDEADPVWVEWLVRIEEEERQKRSLERRIRAGKLGRFKPLADFDWSWPTKIDRRQLEDLLKLRFPDEGTNIIMAGPNGVGKSMLAKNVAHRALLSGYTVLATTASAMLNDLATQDSARGLQRRLGRYCRPRILLVDEVGYLSYGNRHADLLFEVVTRRYDAGDKPVIVTTNKAFSEWREVFPNAACVVTLIDRLVHRSEVVNIEGESYRLKEAQERASQRAKSRKAKPEPGD